MEKTLKLFEPISIGSMSLRNRIVLSPITTNFGSEEQTPTERLIAYYEERAKGGAALITVEACTVDLVHRYQSRSLTLADDAFIVFHQKLVGAIHAYGAKCQPQITHPGPESKAPLFGDGAPMGPSSSVFSINTGEQSREITATEMDRIIEQYGDAALRAQKAGYDGMELHAAHCWMLAASFLSPLRNQRNDLYSGETLEGRTKFLIRVIQCMKERTGGSLPLTLSISGFERIPGGRDIDDTQLVARQLVAAGVDAFRVSGGVMDAYNSQIVTSSRIKSGINVTAAHAIKQVVSVPVIVVGGIHDPLMAEQIIASGKADLIALGRPLLVDPEWPNKARAGLFDDIRRCISCQNCVDSMLQSEGGVGMTCALNARVGREKQLTITRTDKPKRIMVIGAGPAGMELARVASTRGHDVTLYEKSSSLGGALRLASLVDPSTSNFLRFLTAQMNALPIKIKLNTAVDVSHVRDESPDVLVFATGGQSDLPLIPGMDYTQVVSADKLEYLIADLTSSSEHKSALLGERVAVIGANLASLQLAEAIAHKGHEVYLLNKEQGVGHDIGPKRRLEHMLRLDDAGVAVVTAITIEEITSSGVKINTGFESRFIKADTIVVPAIKPLQFPWQDQIKDCVSEIHHVGDCKEIGLIVNAVESGLRTGCSF